MLSVCACSVPRHCLFSKQIRTAGARQLVEQRSGAVLREPGARPETRLLAEVLSLFVSRFCNVYFCMFCVCFCVVQPSFRELWWWLFTL